MGYNNEKDMQIGEIKPEYKYIEKLFALNPLIGNAVISEANIQKINEQAKKIVDKLVEMPSLLQKAPISWHLFVALATVNYAKSWNALEESRFTKYITLQFGYRDDSGKVWGIIAQSLEKALNAKSRFFLKDKGGREFYETVLVHAFAPVNAWDSVFDLLFDFLKNNLRWNYINGDPIIERMIYALSARLKGDTSEEESLLISSEEYRIRLGAKRLIQNRPQYTANLFEKIISRIYDLVNNQVGEPKKYVDYIIDTWFANKLSRMVETEKHQFRKVNRTRVETALAYSKIRATYEIKDKNVFIHIPAIRLEKSGHKFAEIKVYENGRIIGRNIPELFGNELGETLGESDIQVSLRSDNKCNIVVQIFCDDECIYDSGRSLFRNLFVFNESKECSVNNLKIGVYKMYIPSIDKYTFENVNIIQQYGKYIEVELLKDFSISCDGKIIALDTVNIHKTTISEPIFIKECTYCINNEEFFITVLDEVYKVYLDKRHSEKTIQMLCNSTIIDMGQYLGDDKEDVAVYEIPISEIIQVGCTGEISFISLENGAVIYKKSILVVKNLSIRFDKEFYFDQNDYADAVAIVETDVETKSIMLSQSDTVVFLDYLEGSLKITVPVILVSWENIDVFYQGNSIWNGDIKQDSSLKLFCSGEQEIFLEIGGKKYEDFHVNLYSLTKDKQLMHNLAIILDVAGKKHKIGQLVFEEMFITMPIFTSDEECMYWDGGLNFIGNKDDELIMYLYSEEMLQYEINLSFGNNTVAWPDGFVDGEYTYIIRKQNNASVLAQDVQFFGNPNKLRFQDKVIEILEVTEDVGEGTKPQQIKASYIEKIRFVEKSYVPSEDGIFDIYEGQMYFVRPDGTKKYYSNKYADYGKSSYYKVNPVKIIYINERLLRIVNEDEEGLYCYNNFGTSPRLEITDREPSRVAKDYKDILFYIYSCNNVVNTIQKEKKAVVHALVTKRSVFDKFGLVEQNKVIEEAFSRRMLINAGPGTGKTWTLIERIIDMVDVQGVEPDTILVLCFSKAAVDVIKERLAEAVNEGRISEVVNQVDVRTFDSFASQVLYWVKNESDYDNLQYYEIGKMNYDERIELFTSLIRQLPELVSQCSHLIVDEVQDLVKGRARMILELIRSIPDEAGVTLLGDSCQSIYDYQIGGDIMSSAQFYTVMCDRMSGFQYYTFARNYRQNEELANLGDMYRNCILTGNSKLCDEFWSREIDDVISSFLDYSVVDITEEQLSEQCKRGTVGILTRTNGQALKISAILREKGIDHVLRKRLSDNSLGKWIALVFNTVEQTSINESEFTSWYKGYCEDSDYDEIQEIWAAVCSCVRTSSERIGIRDILRGLVSNAKSPALYSKEKSSRLTVTNIHRGKGREFDTVLIEDDIFSENEKPLDEHKVCYVALTRPKKEIYRINAKAEYMRIDKDGDRRCFKAEFVGYNRQRLTYFEVGLANDLDLRSFVRQEGVQEHIRNNFVALIGKKVELVKENVSGEYIKYQIIESDSRTLLGYTGEAFAESLSRALHRVYKLPQKASLYFDVYPYRFTEIYIEDISSIVEVSDGSEIGVVQYGEMVAWNVVNIVGYAKVEYV